jgi:hypothetical protein
MVSQPIRKRHHYLPEYYLKGFSSSNPPDIVFLYKKGEKKKPIPVTAGNVAVQRYYYIVYDKLGKKNDIVEKYLSGIEDNAKSVIDKIRHGKIFSNQERASFTIYIWQMLRRVDPRRQKMKSSVTQMVTQVRVDVEEELTKIIESETNPDKKKIFIENLEIVKNSQNMLENNLPNQMLLYENPNVLNILFKMRWIFFTAFGRSAFITSDNPVFYPERLGLANLQAELSFPISKEIALWATWDPRFIDCYLPANQNVINWINQNTTGNAGKFIISDSDEEWIYNLANN